MSNNQTEHPNRPNRSFSDDTPERLLQEASEAPETQLELQRPGPLELCASGEVKPAPTVRPTAPVTLLVALGRTLVSETHCAKQTISIGRGTNQDIVIDDESVSREHCQLRFESGRYMVRDLGASNGTTLNGRPAIDEPLAPGDEIGVGRFVVIFVPSSRQLARVDHRINASTRMAPPEASTRYLSADQIQGVRQAVRQERGAHLKIIGDPRGIIGPGSARGSLVIAGPNVTLGRDETARIRLSGWHVARRHAEISRQDGRFVLRRLCRFRRLFLNEQSIQIAELSDRDVIRIGRYSLQFWDAAR